MVAGSRLLGKVLNIWSMVEVEQAFTSYQKERPSCFQDLQRHFQEFRLEGAFLVPGAHNIANAQTENFKRTQATLEESSAGGVMVSLSQDQRPGPQFTTGEDPFTLREGSNVELEEELIHTLEASHLIEANLASIRTQDKVLGSLLDIIK